MLTHEQPHKRTPITTGFPVISVFQPTVGIPNYVISSDGNAQTPMTKPMPESIHQLRAGHRKTRRGVSDWNLRTALHGHRAYPQRNDLGDHAFHAGQTHCPWRGVSLSSAGTYALAWVYLTLLIALLALITGLPGRVKASSDSATSACGCPFGWPPYWPSWCTGCCFARSA